MGTSVSKTATSTVNSRTSSSAVHAASGGGASGSSASGANTPQPAGPGSGAAAAAAVAAGAGAAPGRAAASGALPTKEELRKRLSREEYYVTQEKGTERAFTGKYWNEKRRGIYRCVCCDAPLFDSDKKYDSGTGWPSYWDQIGGNVKEKTDFSIPFMPRTEVVCKACGAHLGHVFPDGPRPTGLRYCINSASLRLEAKEG